jgi:exo-1,4-beta-D-glucosaminidase
MVHVPTRTDGPATSASIGSWQVQSSAMAGLEGTIVSDRRYRPIDWHVAPARSTVMAALIANGVYSDVEHSTRLRDEVDRSAFDVPWWFRSSFLAAGRARTSVRADGIIHRADLFVNGTKVADSAEIAGAYTTNLFDVTHLVRNGLNTLAFLVHPGSPTTDLSIGWVDWNQWPPDNNMGVWRDVWLRRTGPVALARPRVVPALAADAAEARLTLSVDVSNASPEPVTATVAFTISLRGGVSSQVANHQAAWAGAHLQRDVVVEAGEERRLTLSAEDTTELVVGDPALWWPIGEGGQPLYDVEITAAVAGAPSDRVATTFGMRSVTSHVEEGGGRQFVVNGRPVQIVGGGYAPDLFLRYDHERLVDELGCAADVGLNAIRLEGKLENPEIYEIADEIGLMVLPGWECCDKWEAHAGSGTTWDDHDFEVAARSQSSEAYRLANHASVVGFFIGSDWPPEPAAARRYVDALTEARWEVPIISSATVEGSEIAGPSGMKMTGPYAWVPPDYWYRTDADLGGAIGFNSETGWCNLPRLPSLERMLSAAELESLWREPEAKQFHAGPPSEFDNIAIFHRALAGRYGEPRSLRDFVAKAQLMSYEGVRAQFEAYRSRSRAERPATGMIYWMVNSAWPSLNWQLWDWYLDPAAAYFAAKSANEPLHVMYAYDEGVVKVLNRLREPVDGVTVLARLRDVDGSARWHETTVVSVAAGSTSDALVIDVPKDVTVTYFVELQIDAPSSGSRGGSGRNVYWLSTRPDVLAVEETSWQHTPTSGYADLRALEALAPPELELAARFHETGSRTSLTVSVSARERSAPAVGLHASVLDRRTGRPIAPICWDDNELVLFAGQAAELSASFDTVPDWHVEVDGFNLAEPTEVVPVRS